MSDTDTRAPASSDVERALALTVEKCNDSNWSVLSHLLKHQEALQKFISVENVHAMRTSTEPMVIGKLSPTRVGGKYVSFKDGKTQIRKLCNANGISLTRSMFRRKVENPNEFFIKTDTGGVIMVLRKPGAEITFIAN
jgi:hypothetical protein